MRLPAPPTDLRGWRTLGSGAALLMTGRLVSAACGFIQVPIALAQLGPERFGVWIALLGVIWTAGGLDFGLGYALQNRLAALFATGRESEANALARRGRALLWWVASGLALGGAALALWGRWSDWLGITDPGLARELRPAVAIALGVAILCVPFSFATRLAAARQQTWLTGWWTAIASLLGLGAVIAAAGLKLSLPGFLLAGCILPLGPHVGTWLHLRWRSGGTRSEVAPSMPLPGLGRESAAFFVPQLGAAFIGSFVPMLVALFSGPAAAATYGVLQRLFGLGLQLQTLALQPTWPAYTHAAAQHNPTAARRIYRLSMLGSLAGLAVLLLLLAPLTAPILRLWLGANAPVVPAALLWLVAGWHAVQFIGQPPAMLLNGAGRAGVVAISSIVGIALTLALCSWLGETHGASGVMAALLLPYLLLNLPLVLWQAARTLTWIGRPPSAS